MKISIWQGKLVRLSVFLTFLANALDGLESLAFNTLFWSFRIQRVE